MIRRLLTIPGVLLAAALVWPLAPLWWPLCALYDRVYPGRAAARTGAFVGIALTLEALALAGLAAVWLYGLARRRLGGVADRERNFTLQRWWTRATLAAAVHCFDLRVEIEPDRAPLPGPTVILGRHASFLDTLVAAAYFADRHRVIVRYLAKDSLRWDPCLDVFGGRLDSVFVRRGRGGGAAALAAATRDLPAGEAVLLFPEGTRYTPTKRRRLLRRADASTPEGRAARRFRAVLPPRLGGLSAVLDANPRASVRFFAHSGLEGAATLADLVAGRLTGRRVRVAWREYPAAQVPAAPAARRRWVEARWAELDGWVRAAPRDRRRRVAA